MLSIGTIHDCDYYVTLSRQDSYYTNGLEPSGQWAGEGADALGLTGAVEPDALRALIQGVTPDGKHQVQNAGKANRQPGWDLTFSADKTVSVLWSQADSATRQAIEACHADAVRGALAYLQDTAGWTRRGRRGVQRERARLVVATFEHGSSRAGDPQLHTHAVVCNAGVREDGTLGAILSKPLFQHKMTAGALYRAELAALLTERLGLVLERNGPFFQVQGVSEALCRAFSQRRVEIEAQIEARGIRTAVGAAAVTLATRTAKPLWTREQLFTGWQAVGQRLGFSERQAAKLLHGTTRTKAPTFPRFGEGVAWLMERESHFKPRELLRLAAEAAPGTGWNARDLREGMEAFLGHDPNLVRLAEDRYTTRDMVAIERGLLEASERMRSDQTHLLTPAQVARAALASEKVASARAGKSLALSPEQRAALEHITQREGRVQVVSGMAGTGKTFFLDAARRAWEDAGYTVLGAALAGKAAQGLQEGAGIQSDTLERLLHQLEGGDAETPEWKRALRAEWKHATWQIDGKTRQKMLGTYHKPTSQAAHAWKYATWQISNKHRKFLDAQLDRKRYHLSAKSVVVVDEASMVGTRAMAQLIAHVEKAGAKLILVGDAGQIQSLGPGGAFAALAKRLGTAFLTGIVRQREAWAAQAVRDFAAGRAREALHAYAQRGLVHIAPTRWGAMERLLSDWKRHGLTRPETCLIFTGLRQERAQLNRMAQEARRRLGITGSVAYRIGSQRFYTGDRVMFTQNSRIYGVQNGTMGTLLSVNPLLQTARFRLDGPEERTVTLALNKYSALDLGYAVTTHKGQGVTVERAYVLAGGPMQNQELTYVQMSRAREETRLYGNQDDVGPEWDDLIRAMETSRRKALAIEVPREEETPPHAGGEQAPERQGESAPRQATLHPTLRPR